MTLMQEMSQRALELGVPDVGSFRCHLPLQ